MPFSKSELGFSRDDCRQMENNVRPPGDRSLRYRRLTDVGREGADDSRKFFRPLRSAGVDERELLDRPAVECAD